MDGVSSNFKRLTFYAAYVLHGTVLQIRGDCSAEKIILVYIFPNIEYGHPAPWNTLALSKNHRSKYTIAISCFLSAALPSGDVPKVCASLNQDYRNVTIHAGLCLHLPAAGLQRHIQHYL